MIKTPHRAFMARDFRRHETPPAVKLTLGNPSTPVPAAPFEWAIFAVNALAALVAVICVLP